MDPNNPIVKLCAEGMQAEAEFRTDDARAAFERAWLTNTNDVEACIAAHYLARHQPSQQETLRWNQEALTRAEAVDDERVAGFFPSLLLNVAHSYEVLGELSEARRHYELAAVRLEGMPTSSYVEMIRGGIADGLRRVSVTA